MFPIHNFDNMFGGAATWQNTVSVGNNYVNGQWFDWRECPVPAVENGNPTDSGYGYKFEFGFENWLASVVFGDLIPIIDVPNVSATCNSRGLTDLGEILVQKMMEKGMIIDIDHMSIKSLNKTLKQAEAKQYPGIAASHVLMYDLTQKDHRHERMRVTKDLERIAKLGGMIGIMTQPAEPTDGASGRVSLQPDFSSIDNDCETTSKTWAQRYEWAVEKMTVDGIRPPVAFGTDFNGISRQVSPRFGPPCFSADAGSAVQYPFVLEGFGSFDVQVTGGREFNFNSQGLAHIGLLPDMVQDLKMLGFDDDKLDPLMRSAEGYIAMWEHSLAVANSSDFHEDCGGEGQATCAPPIIQACDSGLLEDPAADICYAPPTIAKGDFNEDGCVDLTDLYLLLGDVRDRNPANDNPLYDLDGDGRTTALDSRRLVLLFSNPDGSAC